MKNEAEVEKAAWAWAESNVGALSVNGFLAGAKWAEEKEKDDPKAELLELIKSKADKVDSDLIKYFSDIEHVKQQGCILHCYVPPANDDWYWAVVDAIKEFCDRDNKKRYPVGENRSIAGHLSVNFKERK